MPISLPVSILEVLNNKDKKGRMDRNMKLKKMVLHQHKLPGQKRGAVSPVTKFVEEDSMMDTDYE